MPQPETLFDALGALTPGELRQARDERDRAAEAAYGVSAERELGKLRVALFAALRERHRARALIEAVVCREYTDLHITPPAMTWDADGWLILTHYDGTRAHVRTSDAGRIIETPLATEAHA